MGAPITFPHRTFTTKLKQNHYKIIEVAIFSKLKNLHLGNGYLENLMNSYNNI